MIGRDSSGVVVAYLAARGWQLAMSGLPVLTPDTTGYRAGGQSWLSLDLTSVLGSDVRPWPVTLLYALGPTDEWRTILQFILSTLAWSALLVVVGRWFARACPKCSSAGWVVPALLAVVALSPGVSSWDMVLLSESVGLSLCAVVAAGLVLLATGPPTAGTATTLVVGVVLLTIVRPVFAPLALALVAVIGGLVFRKRLAGVLWGAAALMILLGTAYSVWYNTRVDEAWGRAWALEDVRGRTVQQYAILVASPHGRELATRAVGAGAPSCVGPETIQGRAAAEWLHARIGDCPSGIRWLSDHFPRWFAQELLGNPGVARRYFRDTVSTHAVERVDGLAQLPSPVPEPITALFFSSRVGVDPVAGWTCALAGLTVATFLRTRRPRRDQISETDSSNRVLIVLWISLGGAVLAVLATAFASALDLDRVSVVPTTLWRIVLVVLGAELLARPRETIGG